MRVTRSLSREGILDFFEGIDLDHVETVVCKPGFRLFRLYDNQGPNLPHHILEWADFNDNGIVIRSIQRSRCMKENRKIKFCIPTNNHRGMRAKVCKLMLDMARGRNKGHARCWKFNVTKIKEEPQEAVWYLSKRP